TAEAAFKQAREPRERLDCLREMRRCIPKHKGTAHLQADIKTRIKNLTDELAGPKKGGARGGPPTVIRREGAGQLALIGPPNAGKSSLHAHLTGSHAQVGPYAFTTQYPQPGMLPFEDIHFQLIDLPPLSPEHPIAWIGNALQPADACLLMVDLSDSACVEQVAAVHAMLSERRVTLSEPWASISADSEPEADGLHDPFAIVLPTLMLASKADLISNMDDELSVFNELSDLSYPVIAVSVETGEGVQAIGPWLFEHLQVVRVYTKAPGRAADTGQPFTVRQGGTVMDVARLVHKDIAESFKHARLWGGGQFQGQQVGREHVVCDGDILEIHV
ncbi:MAG: GTPase, partial [Gammaproteobacteria bacterium]